MSMLIVFNTLTFLSLCSIYDRSRSYYNICCMLPILGLYWLIIIADAKKIEEIE